MALPNTIIGGATKCGTGSLYFWLADHPEACASKVKETYYFVDDVNRFNENANFINDGLSNYANCFPNCAGDEKVIFEATASYIYSKNALEQIPGLTTEPKVIFLVREPSKRVYSKYTFNKYKLNYNLGSFKDYVSDKGRFACGYNFEEGQYYKHLAKWRNKLGEDRMRVFLFEEMTSNPELFMKKVTEFLDIDPFFYEGYNFLRRNETYSVKNRKLHRLAFKVQPYIPNFIQEKVLPFYVSMNGGKMPHKSEEEKKLISELKDQYKPFNQKLQEDFPYLDLSSWL